MIPPSHITDEMIDRAEAICGMGSNAWDTVPQQEVFAACVNAYLEAQAKLNPQIVVFDCGHEGYPSIYPSKEGGLQCTVCANKMRGFHS